MPSPFSPSVAAIVFGVIFVAELPDKTALASLILGARFRVSHVFCGIAAAFAVHVVLAVMVGGLLSVLPHRWLQGLVGLLFLGGAAMILRHKDEEDGEVLQAPGQQSFWKVAGSGFILIFVAELGDLTQIMTMNLAVRYNAPLSVAVGAVLALWAVAGIGVVGGRALMKRVPLALITKLAAAVMAVMAGLSIFEAIAG